MTWPTIPKLSFAVRSTKSDPIQSIRSASVHERCEHVGTHDNQASLLQPDGRAGLPGFGSVRERSAHGAVCESQPVARLREQGDPVEVGHFEGCGSRCKIEQDYPAIPTLSGYSLVDLGAERFRRQLDLEQRRRDRAKAPRATNILIAKTPER